MLATKIASLRQRVQGVCILDVDQTEGFFSKQPVPPPPTVPTEAQQARPSRAAASDAHARAGRPRRGAGGAAGADTQAHASSGGVL